MSRAELTSSASRRCASSIFSSIPMDQPFAVSAETKLTGIRLGHFAGS